MLRCSASSQGAQVPKGTAIVCACCILPSTDVREAAKREESDFILLSNLCNSARILHQLLLMRQVILK